MRKGFSSAIMILSDRWHLAPNNRLHCMQAFTDDPSPTGRRQAGLAGGRGWDEMDRTGAWQKDGVLPHWKLP